MPDFDDQLRAALATKAGSWSPGLPAMPEPAAAHRRVGLIALSTAAGLVLIGGLTALATHGGGPGRSTIAAAPAVSSPTRPLSVAAATPESSASRAGFPALPSATPSALVAVTPGGPHGPVGSPSPSASPSPTVVTHTLGPPSRDYTLHSDLELSGGEIVLVPSTEPPVATVREVMLAYRAMFTSQAAYVASKPTYKFGVLWKSSGATVLGPQVGKVIWIVGNDSTKVIGSGPASAPGHKSPAAVTSHGEYALFDGATAAPLLGFTD